MKHSDIIRFWSKVNRKASYECWPWLAGGYCGKSKLYRQFWVNGRSVTAHRIAFEIANGPFDKMLHVLHKCDNPICVNPNHLFLGTNSDNIRDKMSKGRWKGGRPKFTPAPCKKCHRIGRIIKEHCKSCYSTIRRKVLGRNGRGPFPI